MARSQSQQTKANRQLAKAGWIDEGDGTYVLGPKPFNSELTEQVLYKVNKDTANTEVYKVSRSTSERSLLASINATTGKITSNKDNFVTFYNNDKQAHKLLIDTAKAETSKNVVHMIQPETAVILSQTSSSPYKGGLVNLNPEELEEPGSNEGPFFEVVELASTSSLGGPITEAEREAVRRGEIIDSDGKVIGKLHSRGTKIKNTTQNDNDADGGNNPTDADGGDNPPDADGGDNPTDADSADPNPDIPKVKPSSTEKGSNNNDDDVSPQSADERNAAQFKRSNKGGTSKGNMQYPEVMNGDRIMFEVVDYQKSGLGNAQGYGIGAASSRAKNVLSTIFLPIQRGYGDTLACNWGEGEINPLTAMAASISYSTIMTAAESGDLGKAAANFGQGIKQGANTILGSEGNAELKQMASAYFAAQAVGMQGFLSRTAGAAINNNLELLFQGPTLRSFNFQFRLTPRSANESSEIRRIIKTFKINMVPEASQSNLFLNAPRVFDIQYLTTQGEGGGKGRLHPFMNKFKRCALRDFSVNYSPDGQYMTYSDAGMTAYEISMTFAELDPVLANDYEGVDDTSEGMGF